MNWWLPLLRRLLSAWISLAVLIFMLFAILDKAPGNYVETHHSPFPMNFKSDDMYHQKMQSEFVVKYPNFAPSWARAQVFVLALIKGDVGFDEEDDEMPILKLVFAKLLNSLVLVVGAFAISLVVGFGLGLWAARRRNGLLDTTLMSAATLGLAVPPYVVAVLLILFFSVFCRRWMIGDVFPLSFLALPAGGWGGWRHLFLPCFVLSLAPLATIARYSRSFALEVMDEPYITNAHAKGLSFLRRFLGYQILPTGVKLLSMLGNQFSFLLVGTVFVEQVFRIPGIGQLFIQAASSRDTGLLVTVTIFLVVLVMIFHILVDLLLTKLDPRVRIEE